MYSKRKNYFWLTFSKSLVGQHSLTCRPVWWALGLLLNIFSPRVYLCYPNYDYIIECGLAKIRLMVLTIEQNLYEQLYFLYKNVERPHFWGICCIQNRNGPCSLFLIIKLYQNLCSSLFVTTLHWLLCAKLRVIYIDRQTGMQTLPKTNFFWVEGILKQIFPANLKYIFEW